MALRGEAEGRPTYVNLHRLPDGSQEVIRCSHAVLGTNCVQKTVRLTAGSLAAEPRLLNELSHPNITPVREAQFDPDHHDFVTFVMPWYDGGSVARALVEQHRFSVFTAIGVLRHALDALEYVHTQKGYVHRDIKSSNLLLDADRTTGFLCDFGHAMQMDATRTAQGILATPEYLAPECAATGRHGPAADIYGMGMILFEMLNGRIRWEDLDRAKVEARVTGGKRALPDSYFEPSAFEPHVPADLVRVTRRAIRSNSDQRFPSAASFVRALNQISTVDWCRVHGEGEIGTWEGSWPPHSRPAQRDRYRVTTRLVERGPASGALRVTTEHQRAGTLGWRKVGAASRDIASDDGTALRKVFEDVVARASHRRAAR